MKQTILTIAENTQLTPTTWRMRMAGDVSAVTAPGQFVDIRLDGHFLRRPISVCDVACDARGGSCGAGAGSEDSGSGILTIIYKVLGQGTEEMTHFEAGKELDVLTGLGNGYDLEAAGDRPLLIGGGVGIPPIYLAAKKLMEKQKAGPGTAAESSDGKNVSVILGFNAADEAYYIDEFRALGCEVTVATADGSLGIKGFVTDAFRELFIDRSAECQIDGSAECGGFTHFYTCGPGPMLKAVYDEIYEKAGIDGDMSFEERMGCGFGACMGCSIRTKNGNRRVCKDGPVFKAEEVLW